MKEQTIHEQDMTGIKIIEYTPDLADAVADMWNHSREGWGGHTSIMTGDQVRQREEQSGNKALFLAVEQDKVVGYCGLSEYKEDEGALYIPLLNVRTDYHGKKIGKMLVLEALKRTVELGWSRLDLYTWAGNTKAVPLYKKCGFFWEDRDDSTHLMNFIPTVLQSELVHHYFQDMDWYTASTREIEVKPDGRKENGFDFFTYKWEHQDKQLTVEFERKGRGLRLVDTEEYYITAELKQADCITGCSYQIEYHVLNKTNKPLEVKIEGQNDRNIQFNFSAYHQIDREKRIVGDFYVGPISEEQSVWRTHPGVKADIWINGKKATFKLGITPKLPVIINVVQPNEQCYAGQASELYLDLESNTEEQVELSFTWPEVSWLTFQESECKVSVDGKGKVSFPISYTLLKHGFYEKDITLSAKLKSGEVLEFKKRVGLSFNGIGALHYGESEENWHICNGLYELTLSKFNNDLIPRKAGMDGPVAVWKAPQLGRPYSLEFSKKRPSEVHFTQEGGAVVLHAIYQPVDFPAVEVERVAKLYANGCIEQSYIIRNKSGKRLDQELALNESIVYFLAETVLPYTDGLLHLSRADGNEYGDWEAGRVDENWVFSKGAKESRGVCWSPKHKLSFNSWFMALEYELGALQENEEVHLDPTFICIDTYRSADEFQAFAQHVYGKDTSANDSRTNSKHKEIESVELSIHGHNPVITDQAQAKVIWRKKSALEGHLSLQAKYGKQAAKQIPLTNSESSDQEELVWLRSEDTALDVLTGTITTPTLVKESQSFVVYPSAQAIEQHVYKDGERDVFVVQNGRLQFKVAPEFFPGVFSLQHLEDSADPEWLQSSYPQTEPKSWWNPWGGGISSKPTRVSLLSLLKEERSSEFASLQDQHGNVWQGIKVRVQVKEHEKFKGLAWNQYFVTLPGTALICHVTEIEQDTQSFWQKEQWVVRSSITKASANPLSSCMEENGSGIEVYTLSESETVIETVENSVSFHRDGIANQLQIITDHSKKELTLYNNKEVCEIMTLYAVQAAHGTHVFLPPEFYIFSQDRIPDSALRDLKALRFTPVE